MSDRNSSSIAYSNGRILRRWDWVFLPLLALVTVFILAAATELIARRIFPAYGDMKKCLVWNDRATGVRGIPNCVCSEKIPEGKPVQYEFNSCGDYTSVECTGKPTGVFRVVMTGTSFPVGLGVAREKTFAVLLPQELSRLTARKVDLYNDSLPRKSPRVIDMRFNEMLATKPDIILWVLNYSDVELATVLAPSDYVPENMSPVRPQINGNPESRLPFSAVLFRFRQQAESEASVLAHGFNNQWRDTRTSVLVIQMMTEIETQHQFLQQNRTSEGQYLSAEPSGARLMHLREFDGYAADILAKAKAAGVPVVATLVPTRVQAAMISNGVWSSDLDPFSLDNELRSIITGHGGIYIDILPSYGTVPNAEHGFFPADGHFNEEGHEVVADLLAKKLTSGLIQGLAGPGHFPLGSEDAR